MATAIDISVKQKINASIFIFVISVLVTGYLFYRFYDEDVPKMEREIAVLKSEIQTKENELKKLDEFIRNIERIKEELRELNLQLETALEHMPQTFDLAGLLKKLNMLAQSSGLRVDSFKPQAEERQGDDFYLSININFQTKGTFTQTLAFLDQLSRLKRIINIQSLRMTPGREYRSQAASQNVGAVLASTSIDLKTYRFAE